MSNLIFWLDFPLFHMSPLIKELSLDERLEVVVVCEREIPDWRKAMGFPSPDFGGATCYFAPDGNIRKKVVDTYSGNDSVHIFHGLRASKNNFLCFKKLSGEKCYIGLYFEYLFTNNPVKRIMRYLYYRMFFLFNNKSIDFLLALGDRAREKYSALGVDSGKIHSFKYFIDDSCVAGSEKIRGRSGGGVKLLYVGKFDYRKNVLMLADSFNELSAKNKLLKITFVGEGEERDRLYKKVSDAGNGCKVDIIPYVDQSELEGIYLSHDVLVLPSRWDGWGMVVVEALARGLPVVVSDRCGAASVITEPAYGRVFDSTSKEDLIDSLSSVIGLYDFSAEGRIKIAKYARDNLSSSAGKVALIDILRKVGVKFDC